MGIFGMSDKEYLKNQRDNLLHEIERWNLDRKVRIDKLPDSRLKTSHLQWNKDKIAECEQHLREVERELNFIREEKKAKQANRKGLFSKR